MGDGDDDCYLLFAVGLEQNADGAIILMVVLYTKSALANAKFLGKAKAIF